MFNSDWMTLLLLAVVIVAAKGMILALHKFVESPSQ